MLAVRTALLLLFLCRWTVSGGGAARHLRNRKDVEIELEPFQIIYVTNDESKENHSLDRMELLSATRQHLINMEFGKHTGFVSLSLVQTLRSSPDRLFQNNTHVAFGGTVLYNNDIMTHEQMMAFEYLCFLGSSKEIYVKTLQLLGWTSLVDAKLMTVSGNMVELDDDGDMMMMEKEDEAVAMMDNESTNTLILVAVIVPIALILFGCLFYIIHLCRTRIEWKAPRDDEDADSVWKAQTSMARKLQSIGRNDTTDDSDDSCELDSVAVTINEKAGTRAAKAPRRQNSQADRTVDL